MSQVKPLCVEAGRPISLNLLATTPKIEQANKNMKLRNHPKLITVLAVTAGDVVLVISDQ
jgi:hypothetical protein